MSDQGKIGLFVPDDWTEYELIDSGDGEKLERFGAYTLIRPEPQAIWKPALSRSEWEQVANARFDREQKDRYRFTDEVKGGWTRRNMPESWSIKYASKDFSLNLRLALTGFGHVGLFPEQGNNWNFISSAIRDARRNWPIRVLNLFAYTGAASVVARMAGAEDPPGDLTAVRD